MKKSRLATSAAALTVAMLMLVGCAPSQPSNPGDAQSGNASTGEAKTASTAPLKFKVTTVNFGELPTGKLLQEEWLKKLTAMFGRPVEPSFEYIAQGDYEQKLKIITAGGDIPDLLTWWKDTQPNLIKYGETGLFEELTQHMDQMPNYKKILDIDTNSKNTLYSPDGKLYAGYFARYQPDGEMYINYSTGVRTDILEKNNLQIPQTVEEFYQVAKALKGIYPDLYPIVQREEWSDPINMLYSANRTAGDRFYDGEKYVFGPITDAYKDALIEMNRWYKDALISPDYFVQTAEQGGATVANGEAMLIPSCWDGYPSNWERDFPDQQWALVLGIRNDKYGDPNVFLKGSQDAWKTSTSYGICISAKSKVKDEMIQIVDSQYSDEMVELFGWGVEGQTFTRDANGEKQLIPEFRDDVEAQNAAAYGNGGCRPGIFPQPQDMRVNVDLNLEGNIYFQGKMTREKTFPFSLENYTEAYGDPTGNIVTTPLTTDENDQYANIMTSIKTYAEEQRVLFIKGERSFDEWDKYLSEINAMGDIQAAMDIYNAKIVKK